MAFNSLRTQLLVWLLVPLTLFIIFNTWVTYRNATAMATAVQDRMLLGSARIIAEQIRYEDGALITAVPPAALELFHTVSHDRVYYRIAGPKGLLLSGYAELPPPPQPVGAEESAYFDTIFRGEPVRVVAFVQPVFAAPQEGPVLIEVAQTMQAHTALAQEMLVHTVRQQLLMLALVALLVWIALKRGIAPILLLRDRVQRRTPGTLQPLDTAPVPNELIPLVHAINDYERRLDEHMSAHSRFIANASHQLRTPLTVLNTQVNYALRSTDIANKDEALRAINNGVQHGIRLVHQMLTLSISEAGIGRPHRQTDVNLIEVVKRVLEELGTLAQAKNIDLGFEAHGARAIVRATPSMLEELVANLVDNALRYTPAGGIVTAVVVGRPDSAILRIEDNGPGIPIDQRERVFERFYRLHEDRSDGSGLGLAIVRQIAAASDAQISLSERSSGAGLIVTVTFPARQSASSFKADAGAPVDDVATDQ